jgi:predicted nucleic acid binding AN1-type Zn finger protein
MNRKCGFEDCRKKILSLAIDCERCHKFYCSVHRLPEQHECEHLEKIKEDAFRLNEKVLVENKLERIILP